jgi:hypothetical protein
MKTTNIHRRDAEFFQRVAASLISRRLLKAQATTRTASKKHDAMAALLDRIASRMRKLPLKERLEFFRSSIQIVAEFLAAMQRDISSPLPIRATRPQFAKAA